MGKAHPSSITGEVAGMEHISLTMMPLPLEVPFVWDVCFSFFFYRKLGEVPDTFLLYWVRYVQKTRELIKE
jgi:hypothetical protein